MRFMLDKTYPDTPLKPFSRLDYLLLLIAFFLSGIAFVPELWRLLLPLTK